MNSRATNGFWKFGPAPSPAVGPGPIEATLEASSPPAPKPHTNNLLNSIRPYGAAAVFVAVAFLLTFILRYFFPYPVLFLFFAAVMASAWFGGTGAGLFAVLLSTLLTDYFFVPPFHSFVVDTTNVSYFGAFVLCALVASWVSSSKKKSELALKDARDQLEVRVMERTIELEKSNAELRWTIQEHDKAQQALRETQSELAHLSRAFSMGELTSSIAHEINQPLAAVVANGHACLEWLSAEPPNVERARRTTRSIIQDGTRAGVVLGRIRSLFKKAPPAQEWLDMNQVIEELTLFLGDEANRRRISLRTRLARNLPRVKGDPVQLQQVVLNLVMNGMDAMSGSTSRPKELVVSSWAREPRGIFVSVEDSGVGLAPDIEGKIFEPFFTTKSHGIGMGLSISRSIVESHGGRLWAEARPSGGAIFQFTIPVDSGAPNG
ncbi:MAG TPA: ATP-binding protein [Candidatus Aquilonibacter sp.]|nr:ATP-binding protein [Candidatus Aquilonibacter sp.]